jgi:hypothetical protein
MCGYVHVGVFLQLCGCFGNLCTCNYCVLYCWYCVFVLFRLCLFILICFVCTSVRTTATECGPGGSVGIATGYGLDGPGIESRWGVRFFAHVQTGPEAHPASCTIGTGSFSGVKRPGPGDDHPPPSSAEVKKEYSCTSIHHLGHFSPVTGQLYLYLYCHRVKTQLQ